MTKTNVWLSLVATGATFGLLAYAVTRRAGKAAPAGVAEESRMISSRERSAPPWDRNARELPPSTQARIDAESNGPTVQFLIKAPLTISADDGEALEADDLGGDWLARAAQSERSACEADLELDLESIADPGGDEPREEESDFEEVIRA